MTDLDRYRSYLPDKRWYEYAFHKFFNPTAEYNSWQPWSEWDYPDHDIERFGKIIVDNLHLVKDCRVLDVACNLGYISFFCSHNGCLSATGTDARSQELDIANEVIQQANVNNVKFVNVDLYNHDAMTKLYNSHDTVILAGIFYHINNHYSLIEQISNSSAKNIIIESEVNNLTTSAIVWRSEKTNDPFNAFGKNKQWAMVGVPSEKFIIDLLQYFGWKNIQNSATWSLTNSEGRTHNRIVISASKSTEQ